MAKPLPTPLRVIAGGATDEGAESLYQSAGKIYPREIKGRFTRMRTAAVFVLLGIFYLFPWINFDGRQMVLFDLPARKFYVLGLVFWPQDFFYLTALLIIAALSLFFFTALAGRLWCGYACPQTVWTEVFLWIERWVEGNRNQQIKLDEGPWTARKWRLKASKQFLWITFALWTGFTFIGFFTPIRELGGRLLAFELGGWEWFWFLFYSLATYGNAGFLREQVCKYMCPYARFQSAMFDRDTLIVSYDTARGEPRGARKRSVKAVAERRALDVAAEAAVGQPPATSMGDCIDCKACVQVCPTGIDIRNGLQYECIGCAACIDACDEVMDKMGYPRGLVLYSTEHAMQGKPVRVVRKRTVFYALLLTGIVSALMYSLATRVPLIVDVIRDRGALYRETAEGTIENGYQLKVLNKTESARRYRVEVLAPATLQLIGVSEIEVPAGAIHNQPLTLSAPAGAIHGMVPVELRVQALDDPSVVRLEHSRFFAPGS